MSFSRSQVKRFNDIKVCGPPVGAYDPKALDANSTAALAFEKSDRFKVPKDIPPCPSLSYSSFNVSSVSSCSSSCGSLTPSKRLFSTSSPNLLALEKKQNKGETAKPVDASKLRELEREIKRLLQERVDQDRLLAKREEELKKLDARFHHALSEKTTLQAKAASLEKQLTDVKKGNDVLKNKITTSECVQKKQDNLQAEINSLKSQISVKEKETTRLRQQMETSVNELLDCLCSSLETATCLTEKEQIAGDLADLRANNLGIHEKFKLATLKVQILKEEMKRTTEDSNRKVTASSSEWETKYNSAVQKQDRLETALIKAEDNLNSSIACQETLSEYRDALCNQVAGLEETVAELRYDQWGYEERIRHLKGELFAEADERKSELQVAFENSAEKAEFEEKIDQLQESNEELNKNIRLMTEKYQFLEATSADEHSRYRNQRETLEAELHVCKQSRRELESEIEELEKTSKDLMKAIGEEKTSNAEKMTELMEELTVSKNTETVKEVKIEALKQEMIKLTDQTEGYREQIQAGEREEANTRKMVEGLQTKLTQLKMELDQLQKESLQVEEKLQEKLHHVQRQHADLTALHHSYTEEMGRRSYELEEEIRKAGEDKAALEKELSTLKLEMTQLSLDAEAYIFVSQQLDRYKSEVQAERTELEKALETANSEKQTISDKCGEIEKNLKEQEKLCEQLSAEKSDICAELQMVKEERQTFCDACVQLETRLSDCDSEKEEVITEKLKVAEDLEKAVKDRKVSSDLCIQMEQKLSLIEQEETITTAERAELRQELEKTVCEKEAAEEKCLHLDAKVCVLEQENEELTVACTKLQDEVEKSVEIRQNISDKYVDLEIKMAVLESEREMEKTRQAESESELRRHKAESEAVHEEILKLQTRLSDLTTERLELVNDKGNLASDIEKFMLEKSVVAERCELLEEKLADEEKLYDMVLSEKSNLLETTEKAIKERQLMTGELSSVKSKLERIERENGELMKERDSLKDELLTVENERQRIERKCTELETSRSRLSTQKEETWTREKDELLKRLAIVERSRDEVDDRADQMEKLLRESERLREEQMLRHKQDEADFQRLLNEAAARRDQFRDQYEQQIEVLHEQLNDSTPNEEIDELRHAMEKWKFQFTELQAKVEPFMEQINAFEMERQALLGRNKDAQHEVEKMGREYAKLLGHQNQKQKIKHILKLKDENNTLKADLAKAREQNSKSKRTIQRLEDKVVSLEGRRGKFDPSMAFQYSKENAPGTKTPPHKHDKDTSLRPYNLKASPLATRNSKYSSPIRDGLGNRL